MMDSLRMVRKSLKLRVLMYMIVLPVAGCSIAFDFGTPAKVVQLDNLRRGASSVADVRRLLGEPRGKGAVRLPVGYRKLLLYDSGRFDQNRSHVRYLVVFLDGETYDGYYWFDVDTKYEESHGMQP